MSWDVQLVSFCTIHVLAILAHVERCILRTGAHHLIDHGRGDHRRHLVKQDVRIEISTTGSIICGGHRLSFDDMGQLIIELKIVGMNSIKRFFRAIERLHGWRIGRLCQRIDQRSRVSATLSQLRIS